MRTRVPAAQRFAQLRTWPPRRWATAFAAAAGTYLLVAIPTDLIDTPLFSREVPPTAWAQPVLIVTAVLAGLLIATYVADDSQRDGPGGKSGLAGGIVSFFAVGCPVCNKLVLITLGTSGAMQYFEPVQPLLAGASIALVAWALWIRLGGAVSCAIPAKEAVDA